MSLRNKKPHDPDVPGHLHGVTEEKIRNAIAEYRKLHPGDRRPDSEIRPWAVQAVLLWRRRIVI